METVILVVYKSEGDAFAAKNTILGAANKFDVELEEAFVIKKKTDGSADIRSVEGVSTGDGILGGAAIGALIGLLGGPVGLGLGLIGGMVAGGVSDVVKEDDIRDRLDELAKKIEPDEFMLVAHLWEYSTAVTDEILKPHGGIITRLDVDAELYKAEKAEMEAIDKAIAEEEAALAVEKAEKKAAREEKLAALKQKREDAKQRFNDSLEKRKKEYKTWSGGKKEKFEEWKKEVEEKMDAAKKESLQKRIDKQATELKELKEKYEAI